jgi:hypothetical protein
MECLHSNKRMFTADTCVAELRRALKGKDGTPEFLALGRAWISIEKMQGQLLCRTAR